MLKELKVIAELRLPKQRLTRPYGVVMLRHKIGNRLFDGSAAYSTHNKYFDKAGGYDAGHYDMTWAEAMEDFQQRARIALACSPKVYEDFGGSLDKLLAG